MYIFSKCLLPVYCQYHQVYWCVMSDWISHFFHGCSRKKVKSWPLCIKTAHNVLQWDIGKTTDTGENGVKQLAQHAIYGVEATSYEVLSIRGLPVATQNNVQTTELLSKKIYKPDQNSFSLILFDRGGIASPEKYL